MARARFIPFIAAVLALVPATARSGALTQEPCGGTVSVSVWTSVGNDVLENLLFADGALWVSDSTAGKILKFSAALSPVATPALTVSSPGGLAQGPDGLVYAGTGNSLANAISRTPAASVIRFDPANPAGFQVYAQGFTMANGLTFGPAGEIYVSNDFDYGLVRITAKDTWQRILTNVWGMNGLVVDPSGRNLYAAITFDQRSPIERMPIGNPAGHETFVQLSLGVASLEPNVFTSPDTDAPLLGVKGLDDMTRDADGNLYPVANGMGELLRVSPSGDACLIASGLQNPSSVRIAPESGPFADHDDATVDFYVTQFDGRIMKVVFTPAVA